VPSRVEFAPRFVLRTFCFRHRWCSVRAPVIEDSIVDKRGVLANLARDAAIELGCGPSKLDPSSIGIDVVDSPAVDVVGDARAVLAKIPDASIARVTTSHFLEHVDDLDGIVREIARVLVDGGTLDAVMPHFSNPYFYSDPTHRRTFGLYTLSYMAKSRLFRREVPRYGKEYGLELVDVRLRFDSNFYVLRMLKRGLTRMVNATRWGQELYEEVFAHIVPCYDVRYVVRRTPR
jgi:SAM-dependent methyltransferase